MLVPIFHTLSRREAQSYLDYFLAEMPACAGRLAETLRGQAADPALVRDFDPSSLNKIWEAVASLVGWQDLYQPASPPERWSPVAPVEGLGDPNALPSWFTTSTAYGLEHFSPRTLWVIDGVARHLGNVLAHTEGWEWKVGRGRSGYVFQNHPVIAGPLNEHSPLMSMAVIVSRHLKGGEGADTLLETYQNWVNSPPLEGGPTAPER